MPRSEKSDCEYVSASDADLRFKMSDCVWTESLYSLRNSVSEFFAEVSSS